MGDRDAKSYIFECFFEIAPPSDETTPGFILQKFPVDYADEAVLTSAVKFAFPIAKSLFNPQSKCQEIEYGGGIEHYTFVLTDGDRNFRYGYCRRFMNNNSTCICLISEHPWFDIFRVMMNKLGNMVNLEWSLVEAMLYSLKEQNLNNYQIGSEIQTIARNNLTEKISFYLPDETRLPKIHENQNLSEYYSAVTPENMILIFISLLMERRVLIISRRLSRLTACVHASSSLLFPLKWQHIFIPVLIEEAIDYCSAPMPYLIGLHASLLARIAGSKIVNIDEIDQATQARIDSILDNPVIFNADTGEVTSSHNDLENFPQDVLSDLSKSLDVRIKSKFFEDELSKSFLKTMASLIGCYKNYMKSDPGSKTPVVFDKELFLSEGHKEFRKSIMQLQSFDVFLDERIKSWNSYDDKLAEFEREADIYQNKVKPNFNILVKKTLQMKNKMKTSSKKVAKDVKSKMDESFNKSAFTTEISSPMSADTLKRFTSQDNTRKYNIIGTTDHPSLEKDPNGNLPSSSSLESSSNKPQSRQSTISLMSDPDIQNILNRKTIYIEKYQEKRKSPSTNGDSFSVGLNARESVVIMRKNSRSASGGPPSSQQQHQQRRTNNRSPLIVFDDDDDAKGVTFSDANGDPFANQASGPFADVSRGPFTDAAEHRDQSTGGHLAPLTPDSPRSLFDVEFSPASRQTLYFDACPPATSPTASSSATLFTTTTVTTTTATPASTAYTSTPVRPPRPTTGRPPFSHYPLTPPPSSSSSTSTSTTSKYDRHIPVATPRKSKMKHGKADIADIDLMQGCNVPVNDSRLSVVEQFDPLSNASDVDELPSTMTSSSQSLQPSAAAATSPAQPPGSKPEFHSPLGSPAARSPFKSEAYDRAPPTSSPAHLHHGQDQAHKPMNHAQPSIPRRPVSFQPRAEFSLPPQTPPRPTNSKSSAKSTWTTFE